MLVSAKFGTCTVVSVNGTLVEDKMRGFKGECAHFSFNKCPIYTHDSASDKFSTNSHKTDNSVGFTFAMMRLAYFRIFFWESKPERRHGSTRTLAWLDCYDDVSLSTKTLYPQLWLTDGLN